MRRNVLLTGFEPFDGASQNSSWALAQGLHGHALASGRIVQAVQLPCRFGTALQRLEAALQDLRPSHILAMGQASARTSLSFERVALNWIDARIPDNDGLQPVDVPVLPGAPAAYFSNLPIKTMVNAVRAAGLPAEVSYSAGSYVCNQVFYFLMHRLRSRSRARAGFLHVPALEGGPSTLSLDDLQRGLLAALEVLEQAETHAPGDGRTD
ncbi:pyroglutamyl-peptidase [Inhella inkyongensis]|uniref:Pyroglutamyl-peptidase I n=1 Tax=Inhella inkyongensis TaxID=392593 RepID=A0A840SB53_9BURK|nr:pyroglutamyl-peptidase I [Inhella inkyongensis]MBB5205701.1 pyroglutamyl-peptidase [Inhella inkyongensis]